ncbi:AAA family ATPase [Bacillus thuringiensis]|uniref:AAA family ATPase n=1 Tax=Bacillus thuringiensis TaxID=1428 RepID=UPI0039B7281A
MELAYIWIKGFKEGLINEQGFNFDNQYRYQCKIKDKNRYEIYIKETSNYIEDLFVVRPEVDEFIAKIRNITAIVGQNGAGKSSILDFIKGAFRKKENFSYRKFQNEDGIENCIYILREYINGEKKHYIYHSSELEIDVILENNINFFYESKFQNGLKENLKNTSIIYFSNVYDCKDEYSNDNLLNISTNYLTNSLFDSSSNSNIKSEGKNYKFREIKRQIQFIHGMNSIYNKINIPFDLPNEIDVLFATVVNTSDSWRSMESMGLKFTSSLVLLHDKLRGRNKLKIPNMSSKKVMVLRKFAWQVVNHLFSEINRSEFEEQIMHIDFSFTEGIFKNDSRNEYLILIRRLLEFSKITEEAGLFDFSRMLKALALLMIEIYKHVLYSIPDTRGYNGRMLTSFNTEGLEKRRFEKIIDYYEKSYIKHEFLNFSWRSMSSGETALLNIYARFYFTLSLENMIENPENDLIILIDEGEVYLHPHWQGQLINSLIDYFSIIFKNSPDLIQRNIQIILTSNSPFVVSDLPSSNIIFLAKEFNKSVVVDGLEDYHQTFAANIHSLLSHAFFMEDGVTGAFAKRKINEIVHLLINEDINTILRNEKRIEKTINLIGEPLIRNKLSQMLSDKLSIRMMSVEREIKDLKARLEELERWKGDTDKA